MIRSFISSMMYHTVNNFYPGYDGHNKLTFEVWCALRGFKKKEEMKDGGFYIPPEIVFELLCLVAPTYGGEC